MKIILHTKTDKAWYWRYVDSFPDATIVIDAIGKKHKLKNGRW